jgi:hypothetical protein
LPTDLPNIETKGVESPACTTKEFSHFAIFGILLLATIIRVFYMVGESVWYDELVTTEHLDQPSLQQFLDAVQHRNSPVQPLYLVLEYYWAHYIGSSDISLRILSLIPAILAIYLTFLLVERFHSRKAGNLTALLLTLSGVNIYYSIEIRMYSLTLMLVLFSTYSFFKLLDTNKIHWWCFHILTTSAIVWTHILGVFILPCLALYAYRFGFKKWQASIGWTILHTLAVFTIIPWLLEADMTEISDQYTFRLAPTVFMYETTPRPPSIQWMLQYWTTTQTNEFFNPSTQLLLTLANWGAVIMYTIGFSILTWKTTMNTVHQRTPEIQKYNTFLIGLFIIPIFILYAISHLWEPSFFPRYILISSVALVAILSIFISSIKSTRARTITTVLILGCVAIQTLVAGALEQRRPWDKVIGQLDSEPYLRPKLVLLGRKSKLNVLHPEVKYHLGERDNKIVMYQDFDNLEKYILQAYVDNLMLGQNPREIILLSNANDFLTLINYLDKHELGYSVEHFRTRQYLKYVRINPN